MTPPQRDRRTFQCPRQWRSLRRQPAVQNPRPQPWPGAKEQTSRRDVGVFTVLVRLWAPTCRKCGCVPVWMLGCIWVLGCIALHGARPRVRYRASGEHKSTCLPKPSLMINPPPSFGDNEIDHDVSETMYTGT